VWFRLGSGGEFAFVGRSAAKVGVGRRGRQKSVAVKIPSSFIDHKKEFELNHEA
jgi:hypothetical protein